MDDGGGAGLLYGLAAGVSVQAASLGPPAPHTSIHGIRSVAAATVRPPHQAVVQGDCGTNRERWTTERERERERIVGVCGSERKRTRERE